MSEGPKLVPENQTGGEKLFDLVAYQGIGWLANMAVGVGAYNLSKDIDGFQDAKATAQADEPNMLKNIGNQINYRTRQAIVNTRQGLVDFSTNKADNAFLDSNGEYRLAATRDTLRALNKETFDQLHQNGAIGKVPENYFDANGNVKLDTAEKLFFDQYDKGFDKFSKQLNVEGINADTIKDARNNMVAHQRWRTAGNTVATATAISAGGYAVMIPIKIMEDNKLPLVKIFDKALDKVNNVIGNGFASEFDKQQTLEKREERYKEIENEPKQTWGSMFASRVISVTPFYLIYAGLAEKNNVISGAAATLGGNEFSNPDKGFQGWEHHVDQASNFALNKSRDLPFIGDKIPQAGTKAFEEFKGGTNMIATDLAFSYLVANVTYGMTRVLAPILGNTDNVVKDEDAERQKEPVAANNNIKPISGNNAHNNVVSQITEHPQAVIETTGRIKDGALQEREPALAHVDF